MVVLPVKVVGREEEGGGVEEVEVEDEGGALDGVAVEAKDEDGAMAVEEEGRRINTVSVHYIFAIQANISIYTEYRLRQVMKADRTSKPPTSPAI